MLEKYINHLRGHAYMSKANKTARAARVKDTGEIFTPTPLVQEILNNIEKRSPELFEPLETALDPTCGDGQFLSEVLIKKLERIHKKTGTITDADFEIALSSIYGVDYVDENVDICRRRLLCGRTDLEHIVKRNIIQHDSLLYDWSFNGTNKTNQQLIEESILTEALPPPQKVKKPKKEKFVPNLGMFEESVGNGIVIINSSN